MVEMSLPRCRARGLRIGTRPQVEWGEGVSSRHAQRDPHPGRKLNRTWPDLYLKPSFHNSKKPGQIQEPLLHYSVFCARSIIASLGYKYLSCRDRRLLDEIRWRDLHYGSDRRGGKRRPRLVVLDQGAAKGHEQTRNGRCRRHVERLKGPFGEIYQRRREQRGYRASGHM
jgi:hypothetical protein